MCGAKEHTAPSIPGLGRLVRQITIGGLFLSAIGGCSDAGFATWLGPAQPVDGGSETDFFDALDEDYFAEQQAFEEAVLAYEAELAELAEMLQSLPSLAVRIVNDTPAIVSVNFVAGFTFPEYPESPDTAPDVWDFVFPYDNRMQQVDERFISVPAFGTAEGEFRCAGLIAVSILALSESNFVLPDNRSPVLYIVPGNIELSGIGDGEDRGFTGDVVSGARFFRPEDDGIDCDADTLVIHVESAPTSSVYDEQAGEIIVGAAPGRATLSIE